MATTNSTDLYNVTLHNFEGHNTMNKSIANRNFPSNNLAMNFSFRPVNTKYTLVEHLIGKTPSNKTLAETTIHTDLKKEDKEIQLLSYKMLHLVMLEIVLYCYSLKMPLYVNW